jgi:molybdate transport system permease protein
MHNSNNQIKGSLRAVTLGFLFIFLFIIAALITADIYYLFSSTLNWSELLKIVLSENIRDAFVLSVVTSLCSLVLVMLFAVPVGYALSRYRFPGHTIINTFVDIPLILPPVVLGVSLLAFFGTPVGIFIKSILKSLDISLISGVGIVMG